MLTIGQVRLALHNNDMELRSALERDDSLSTLRLLNHRQYLKDCLIELLLNEQVKQAA